MKNTDPQITEAAFRLYSQVKIEPIKLQELVEDIIQSPNYDEKWSVLVEAFSYEPDLQTLYWKTLWREYTAQRVEVVFWLEDKVIALKSRAQMQLRKYRDFEELDNKDARKMMKRFVSTNTRLLKFEDKLRAIKEGAQ